MGDVARIGTARLERPEPRIPDIPRQLTPDATQLDVVRAAISPPVERLLRVSSDVRLGRDPEAIHDARVAVRRLRSHLRLFRRVLDRDWTDALRGELEWLGDEIAPVRDAEVLRERLWSRLKAMEAAGPGAALIVALGSRRVAARRELLASMASARFRSLLEALERAAIEPRGRAPRAGRPAERALRLMAAPWHRLDDRASSAGSDPADETLHRIRIDAKRVRYGAEAFTPIVGKAAARFADAASSLQDVLGEHQDAVTSIAWVRDQAERTDDPLVAYTAGRLAEVEERRRSDARKAWRRAWRRLERRKRFWA